MIIRYPKHVEPRGAGNGGNSVAKQAGDDDCRCKETSEMTPRELFRLMIRDLSFWKRPKKE